MGGKRRKTGSEGILKEFEGKLVLKVQLVGTNAWKSAAVGVRIMKDFGGKLILYALELVYNMWVNCCRFLRSQDKEKAITAPA